MHCLLCGFRCAGVCLCRACIEGLPRNLKACRSCGLPLGAQQEPVCGACLRRPLAFDRVYAPLLYEFPVDRLIHLFKFRRNLSAGKALAHIMAERMALSDDPAPLILVPVPLHWMRRFSRGYNQATELARHLALSTGLRLVEGNLTRKRPTRAQAGLDAASRRRNMRKAFHWKGPPLTGTCVLLIDDVMTTGSTTGECARVLRKAGAESVEAWVAARAIRS